MYVLCWIIVLLFSILAFLSVRTGGLTLRRYTRMRSYLSMVMGPSCCGTTSRPSRVLLWLRDNNPGLRETLKSSFSCLITGGVSLNTWSAPVPDVLAVAGEGHGDVLPGLQVLSPLWRLAAQLTPTLLEDGLPLLLRADAQPAQLPVRLHANVHHSGTVRLLWSQRCSRLTRLASCLCRSRTGEVWSTSRSLWARSPIRHWRNPPGSRRSPRSARPDGRRAPSAHQPQHVCSSECHQS